MSSLLEAVISKTRQIGINNCIILRSREFVSMAELCNNYKVFCHLISASTSSWEGVTLVSYLEPSQKYDFKKIQLQTSKGCANQLYTNNSTRRIGVFDSCLTVVECFNILRSQVFIKQHNYVNKESCSLKIFFLFFFFDFLGLT